MKSLEVVQVKAKSKHLFIETIHKSGKAPVIKGKLDPTIRTKMAFPFLYTSKMRLHRIRWHLEAEYSTELLEEG